MDFAGLIIDQAARSEGEGDLAAAEMLYRGLLKESPANAQGCLRLGLLLCRTGSPEEGLDLLGQAVDAAPRWPEAHLQLGKALHARGRNDEAMAAYLLAACLQAAAVAPQDDAQAHFNLGMAFNQSGRDADAARAYRQAVAVRPQFGEAYNNLGISLHDPIHLTDSATAHRRAVDLSPGNAGFHTNFAHALLASGRLAEGLAEWEWRSPSPPRDFTQPRWDGSPFPGRTLLAHAEQGYGDVLQFCRYLPETARLGGRLIVECRKPMMGLLGRMSGVAEVVEWGQPLPPFDLQIPVPSLAHALGVGSPELPGPVPYLGPDETRLEEFRRQIATTSDFTVGLVWAGNPRHGNDRRRSLPLDQLRGLRWPQGAALYSLQMGAAEQQWAYVPGAPPIHPLGGHIRDFDDLAAAMELLDLVITVDSAPAHMAGALGRPVWTLLPYVADWRWQLSGDTTPWYPSMRLYRQSRPDQWGDVMDRVAADLAAQMSSRTQ